jgi:hypothetical protein
MRRVRDGVRRTYGVRAEGKDAISLSLLIAMLATRDPGPPPDAAPALEQLTWLADLEKAGRWYLGQRRQDVVSLNYLGSVLPPAHPS